jgi:hypothetical protein
MYYFSSIEYSKTTYVLCSAPLQTYLLFFYAKCSYSFLSDNLTSSVIFKNVISETSVTFLT